MTAEALIQTPIGHLHLIAGAAGLKRAEFFANELLPGVEGGGIVREKALCAADEILAECIRQFEEYFAGSLRQFDLPLDISGTPFQKRVWQSIAAIPFGSTATYAEIASAAGATNAYRAAGTACGANRVVLAIPCHRVVGSDRGLHGFGGGLHSKAWLLAHESALGGSAGPNCA